MILDPLKLLLKIKPFGYSGGHIKKLFEQGAVYLLDGEWEKVDSFIYTEETEFTFRFGKKQVFQVVIK